MPNSVVDVLTDWQADADGADTNLPVNGSQMGDDTAGDLDGEFRRVKSELRAESLIKSWERWRGVLNLAEDGPIAFTFVSAAVFTVNDNFLHTNRYVAVVGRRLRAILSGGMVYGTVSIATFSSPNTAITVAWDTGDVMDASLSEVQFGPEPRSSAQPALILDGGEPEVRNTDIETPIYSTVVRLSEFMHGAVGVFIPSMLTGSTFQIRIFFGGSELGVFLITNATGITVNGFGFHSEFRVHNRNSFVSQGFWISGEIPRLNDNLYLDGVGVFRRIAVNGITVDTSVSQAFQVNGLWSVASASNHAFGLGLDIWRPKFF